VIQDQPTIHAWNTGCRYTQHGQRIAYAALECGRVAFLDRDRGIDGVIAQVSGRVLRDDPRALRETVHRRYLHNEYDTGFYILRVEYAPEFVRELGRRLRAACDALAEIEEAR
jgi:hypothetical protein